MIASVDECRSYSGIRGKAHPKFLLSFAKGEGKSIIAMVSGQSLQDVWYIGGGLFRAVGLP